MAVLSEVEYLKKRTAVIAKESTAKECCKTDGNLGIKKATDALVTLSCKVCGVNHYIVKAEGMKQPISMNSTNAPRSPAALPFDPSFSSLIDMGVSAED